MVFIYPRSCFASPSLLAEGDTVIRKTAVQLNQFSPHPQMWVAEFYLTTPRVQHDSYHCLAGSAHHQCQPLLGCGNWSTTTSQQLTTRCHLAERKVIPIKQSTSNDPIPVHSPQYSTPSPLETLRYTCSLLTTVVPPTTYSLYGTFHRQFAVMICSVLLLVLLMCLCQALIHDQQQSTINERDGLLNFNVNRRNLRYTRGHWTVCLSIYLVLVRPIAAPRCRYYY